MSENSTPEERTEDPTDRRMQQLRKDGALPISNDTNQVVVLVAGFLALYCLWDWFVRAFKLTMLRCFDEISHSIVIDRNYALKLIISVASEFTPPFVVMICTTTIVASLSVMLQTKWNVKEKKIEFKFSSLNPISGIKKIFSLNGFMMTLKAIVKLSLILPIGYFALKELAPQMIKLIHMNVADVLSVAGMSAWQLFWKIVYVLICLAVFDFMWTKRQWLKQNRMTKEEVKNERKSMEGDETTKRAIQAKGLSRIAQRIRQSVPQADVIITNPTHYAIALKYDRSTMSAPKVVAKGRGFLALRIREIAKEAKVPIVERKLLARALYASTEVGSEIPYELFRAVAEVLAYVYRLKTPFANRKTIGQAG